MPTPPKYYRNEFEGAIGAYYDTLFWLSTFGFQKRMRTSALSYIPKNSKKILDMACGTGSETILIKKHLSHASVTGIDLSKTMLAHAKRKTHIQSLDITFRQENIENTSFADASFDAITICFALHEMPHKHAMNTLKEIKRLLTVKGVLVILELSTPRFYLLKKGFEWYCKINEPYFTDFTSFSLADELQHLGFLVSKNDYAYNGLIHYIKAEKSTK